MKPPRSPSEGPSETSKPSRLSMFEELKAQLLREFDASMSQRHSDEALREERQMLEKRLLALRTELESDNADQSHVFQNRIPIMLQVETDEVVQSLRCLEPPHYEELAMIWLEICTLFTQAYRTPSRVAGASRREIERVLDGHNPSRSRSKSPAPSAEDQRRLTEIVRAMHQQ